MKRFLALVFSLICIAACQKAPELTLSGPATIEISADGSRGMFTFTANRDWTAACSESWIHVSPSSGSAADGQITVSIHCDANTTYEDRSGTVTIKVEDLTQTITVKQAQKDALIVKDSSFNIPYGGGGIEFFVEANVSFDVSPNVEWIHFVGTKALNNSTISLAVDENPTYNAREGKVEIKQTNGSLVHTVTIKQAGQIAVTSIELDKTSLSLKKGGSEILIATIKPDNATDKTVMWSSTNTKVATVDNRGVVTGMDTGQATITARIGEQIATCEVTVSEYYENVKVMGVIAPLEADPSAGDFPQMKWKEGDKISILFKGEIFTYSADSFGDNVTFSLDSSSPYPLSGYEGDVVYAVKAPSTITGDRIVLNNQGDFFQDYNLENKSLPDEILRAEGQIKDGSLELRFTHVFAYLKVSLNKVMRENVLPKSNTIRLVAEYGLFSDRAEYNIINQEITLNGGSISSSIKDYSNNPVDLINQDTVDIFFSVFPAHCEDLTVQMITSSGQQIAEKHFGEIHLESNTLYVVDTSYSEVDSDNVEFEPVPIVNW